jgi:hypothetical protein
LVTALALLGAPVVGVLAFLPGQASATGSTLFVSASNGNPSNPDTSCATAKYTTIGAALADATTGSIVEVCNGTYDEQVTITTSGVTLEAASGESPVIEPTSFSGNATDAAGSGAIPGLGFPPPGTPIAAIVAVGSGVTGVTVSGLTVDGENAASSTFLNPSTPAPAGCGAAELAGVLVQGGSATFSGDTIENTAVPPCDGVGAFTNAVFVESPGSTSSHVTVTGSTIDAFGKNGVACINSGTSCTVSGDTITGDGPNPTFGQNGVQIGPGGTGVITGSTISDVDYTGPNGPPEPQASYAAGVLLYAADGSFDGSGGQATLGNVTQITSNTLTNDQLGVAMVKSSGYVTGNTIDATTPVSDSVGVFAVPCDIFCSTLGLSPADEQVWVSGNTISAGSAAAGIWIGDSNADNSGHTETGVVYDNAISGATAATTFGEGSEIVPAPPTGVRSVPVTATAATVSWTAPTFTGADANGPLPVTGYTIVANPPCASCTGLSTGGTATSTTVGGLTAGQSYTFTVFASNAAGPGPSSLPSGGLSPTMGYWEVASDGGIFSYGDAQFYGSTGSLTLNKPIVGMAATKDGGGYWLVASDGGIFNYGDAKFFGSAGSLRLNKPIVGMAATTDGGGYWLVASDGGIFSYGDAKFFGSAGSMRLNKPIVGMAATNDGGGYWLVASDGGIFSYGDAKFFGSTGSIVLNKPVVGMAATPDGAGYWLVASDGGIFNYGDAKFFGSTGSIVLNKPVVGMAATPDGAGYWLVASDGGIFSYGDAQFYGSTGNIKLNKPMVGMAAT